MAFGFGLGSEISFLTQQSLNDIWLYDINRNMWKFIGGTSQSGGTENHGALEECSSAYRPRSRYGSNLHFLGNGKIIFFFGLYDDDVLLCSLNSVWDYNVTNNDFCWREGVMGCDPQDEYMLPKNDYSAGASPGGRYSSTSWRSSKNVNEIFFFGGRMTLDNKFNNDVWVYHVDDRKWKWMCGEANPVYNATLPQGVYSTESIGGRYQMAALLINKDEALLHGGRRLNTFWADMYLYNMTSFEFKYVGGSTQHSFDGNLLTGKNVFSSDSIPAARSAHFMWGYQGKVYMYAGGNGDSIATTHSEVIVFTGILPPYIPPLSFDFFFLYYLIPSVIAGVFLSCLMLFIVFTVVIICVMCVCKRKEKNEDINESVSIELKSQKKNKLGTIKAWFSGFNMGSKARFEEEEEEQTPKVIIHRDISEINIDEVKLICEIGSGGSTSTIFLADWNGAECAFKVFQTSGNLFKGKFFEEFEKEVSIVASINHPNIIQNYGFVIQEPRIGILLEYCSLGELGKYIKTKSRKKENVSLSEKKRMCVEIAKGMNYLHNNKIIHRDLKCANVLLNKGLVVKIIDFGLAKITNVSKSANQTTRVGTSYYMAPEVLRGKYNSKCDVFSFSIIFYEVYSENFNPYKGRDKNGIIELMVANNPNFRPILPRKHNFSKRYVDLMRSCWDHDPSNRPSFAEIIKIFQEN